MYTNSTQYDVDLQLLRLREENLMLRKDNEQLMAENEELKEELERLKEANKELFNENDRVLNENIRLVNTYERQQLSRKIYSKNSLGLFKIEDCEDMLILYSNYMTGNEIVREMELYVSAEAFYSWIRDYNFECAFGALNDNTLKIKYGKEFDEETKREIIHELIEHRLKGRTDIPIETIIKNYL